MSIDIFSRPSDPRPLARRCLPMLNLACEGAPKSLWRATGREKHMRNLLRLNKRQEHDQTSTVGWLLQRGFECLP